MCIKSVHCSLRTDVEAVVVLVQRIGVYYDWSSQLLRVRARNISHQSHHMLLICSISTRIYHTSDYRQYFHVCNTAQLCRLGVFMRIQNQPRGESLMYLWKPNIDMQETNVSIPQSKKIWSYFVGCWTANGYVLSTSGMWLLKCYVRQTTPKDQLNLFQETCAGKETIRVKKPRPKTHKWLSLWKQRRREDQPRCWSIVKCGLRTHKHTFFSRRVSVEHLWGQWGSTQDDHQRTKSHNETRVQNPQSCSWLVFDRINWDPKIQNKYVESKNQLAGSFTRDERNHHLLLFNIMNFSMFSVPRQRKDKKRLSVKVHRWQYQSQWIWRWRSPGPWIWCCTTRWVRGRTLCKIWEIPWIQGMPMKDKVVKLASGNSGGLTEAKIQSSILKWGDRKTLKMQTLGNRNARTNLRQSVPRNWCGRWTQRSFITWRSQIINTWQRFSNICRRSCESQWVTQ